MLRCHYRLNKTFDNLGLKVLPGLKGLVQTRPKRANIDQAFKALKNRTESRLITSSLKGYINLRG